MYRFRNDKTHNKIVDDVKLLKVPSTSSVFRRPQEEIVEEYKIESKINDIDNKFYLIDFLKDKMTNILYDLRNLSTYKIYLILKIKIRLI